MSPCWSGKFVCTLRSLREVVSQTKFGRNVNNIQRPSMTLPSGPIAREAALLEFHLEYSPAYRRDAAFQPPVWRAQVSRTTSAGFYQLVCQVPFRRLRKGFHFVTWKIDSMLPVCGEKSRLSISSGCTRDPQLYLCGGRVGSRARSRCGKASRSFRLRAYWKCLLPIWIAAPVSSSKRSVPMKVRLLINSNYYC